MFFVFLTTLGPHHCWSKTASWPLCLIRQFCAQRTILDPKNLGQWDCSSSQFVGSCLVFWAMDLPARDLPCPRPPCAGSPVVVWCVVRCVFKFFVGASKIWALPLTSPSAGPPLRRTVQNFALFFLSLPLHFRSFSLSGGLLVEFWWCLNNCARLGSRAVV